jgi:hypothetical protein
MLCSGGEQKQLIKNEYCSKYCNMHPCPGGSGRVHIFSDALKLHNRIKLWNLSLSYSEMLELPAKLCDAFEQLATNINESEAAKYGK